MIQLAPSLITLHWLLILVGFWRIISVINYCFWITCTWKFHMSSLLSGFWYLHSFLSAILDMKLTRLVRSLVHATTLEVEMKSESRDGDERPPPPTMCGVRSGPGSPGNKFTLISAEAGCAYHAQQTHVTPGWWWPMMTLAIPSTDWSHLSFNTFPDLADQINQQPTRIEMN